MYQVQSLPNAGLARACDRKYAHYSFSKRLYCLRSPGDGRHAGVLMWLMRMWLDGYRKVRRGFVHGHFPLPTLSEPCVAWIHRSVAGA